MSGLVVLNVHKHYPQSNAYPTYYLNGSLYRPAEFLFHESQQPRGIKITREASLD